MKSDDRARIEQLLESLDRRYTTKHLVEMIDSRLGIRLRQTDVKDIARDLDLPIISHTRRDPLYEYIKSVDNRLRALEEKHR